MTVSPNPRSDKRNFGMQKIHTDPARSTLAHSPSACSTLAQPDFGYDLRHMMHEVCEADGLSLEWLLDRSGPMAGHVQESAG